MNNYDKKDVDCIIFIVKGATQRTKIPLFDMSREQALKVSEAIKENNDVVGPVTIHLNNGNII